MQCSKRRCIRDSIFEVLSFSLDGPSVKNFVSSSRMEFIFFDVVGFVQNDHAGFFVWFGNLNIAV